MKKDPRDVALFGPIIFWASFFSFAIAMLYSIKDLLQFSNGASKSYTIGLTFFLYLYLVRIYCGVLFVSYDDSINEVLLKSTHTKKLICHLFQFFETLLILTAPVVFAAFQLNGGYLVLGIESFILTIFWFFYFREFLFKDSGKFGNRITLILDISALAPFILHFVGSGLEINLKLGIMIGFSFIYVFIFGLEFWYVYRQSWSSFWAYTRPLIIRD